MMSFLKKYWICLTAMIVALTVDQVTKHFATYIELSDPESNQYYIITFFEKIYNMAGAHFFLINVRHYFDVSQILLRMVILPVIGCYVAYYLIRHQLKSRIVFFGLGMLVGALFGNALDIIFRGYVIDWLGSSFFYNSFELNYAINIADIFAVFSAPFVLVGVRKAHRESVLEMTRCANLSLVESDIAA